MKKIIFATVALLLFAGQNLFAYPTEVKADLSLEISQATGGLAVSNDGRYLFIAYGETLSVVDLATFELAEDQPPALSTKDETDGNIGGIVYSSESDKIYAAQSDGDLLSFNSNDITATPVSETVMADKALAKMASNQTGTVLYLANVGDGLIYNYGPGSAATPMSYNLKELLSGVTFSIKSLLYANTTDELYVSTDVGRIFYITSGGVVSNPPIEIDTVNGDDVTELAVTPAGDKVFAINSTDNVVEVISTSGHTIGTPIEIDADDNTGLVGLTIAEAEDGSGGVYGFVSGSSGISVFDTSTGDLIDIDDTNEDGTHDPIPTTNYGYMLTADNGYMYISSGGGDISVLTERPWINVSDVTYKDASGETVGYLKEGGSFTIAFTSDKDGEYEVKGGGGLDGDGTLMVPTAGDASGSATADQEISLTFSYADNDSVIGEGISFVYVFVTDSSNLTGHMAKTVNVDTPPAGIAINGTGFGDGRVYVNFNRLTASDIDYYNLYVDADYSIVQTKTTKSATVDQPEEGDTVTGTINGLDNGTTYYVAVEAVDTNGNVGTRSYQFADGSAASGMPQATIGPSALMNEAGGCSLNSNARFSYDAAAIVLLSIVILLGMKKKNLLIILFLLFAFSTNLYAADEKKADKPPPTWWSGEFRTGFWMPSNGEMDPFFSKCCNLVFAVSGGLLYDGKYGAEMGLGFMSKSGHGIGASTLETSNDKFNMTLLPMETNLVWRANYFRNQPVVPYIKTGFDYIYFRENMVGHVVQGLKTGLHAGGGLQIIMNWLDSDAGAGGDFGEDYYLTLEAKYGWINSFGKEGLDFSGPVYSAGILFEF